MMPLRHKKELHRPITTGKKRIRGKKLLFNKRKLATSKKK